MMYNQKQRDNERSARFYAMNVAAKNNNVSEYFRLYVQYLEWDNIVSNSRRSLHGMMVEALKYLPMETP